MAMMNTPLTVAPMFIPRAATNSCSATYASCPSDADNNTGLDPSSVEKQGAHRFIGVGMVAGLILIIILVWLYCGKRPRKFLRQHCCCCRRSEELPLAKPIDDETDETPPIQTASSEKDKSTTRDSELVSAGMVVFTKVPKALSKERRHPVEWEMDHVNGIRVEVLNFICIILLALIAVLVRHELHLTMRGMAVDEASFFKCDSL